MKPGVPSSPSLTRRVITGGIWGLFGTGGQALLALGSSIIIARYLEPTDFAVVAIAGAIMSVASRASQFGLAESIVRQRGDVASLARSSLTVVLFIGIALGSLIALLASQIADFYGDPRLGKVLPWLSLSLLLGFIVIVPRALLQRELRLREINSLDLAQRFMVTAGGAGLAIAGAGYWALVAPGVAAMFVTVPLTFIVARLPPIPSTDFLALRGSVRFGAGVFSARTLSLLCDEIDYFFLGRYLPSREFGLYYFAYVRARQPYTMIGPGVQEPLFSAFSKIGDDMGRMRQAVFRVASVHYLIFAPLSIGLFLIADPLVPLIFGEKWRAAIPVCRAFCIMSLLPAAGGFTGSVMLALGRSWLMTLLNGFRLLAVSLALVLGIWLGYDVLSITIALVVANGVVLTGHLVVMYRLIGASLKEALGAYGVTTLTMAAGAAFWSGLGLAGLIDRVASPALIVLLFALIFGAVMAIGTLSFNKAITEEARSLLREWRSK